MLRVIFLHRSDLYFDHPDNSHYSCFIMASCCFGFFLFTEPYTKRNLPDFVFVSNWGILITLSSIDGSLKAEYAQLLDKLLTLSRFSSHLAMLGRYRIFSLSISCFSYTHKIFNIKNQVKKNPLHSFQYSFA